MRYPEMFASPKWAGNRSGQGAELGFSDFDAGGQPLARRIVGGACELPLQGLEILLHGRTVDVFHRHRLLGKDSATLARHLGEAAGNEDAVADRRTVVIDVDDAGPDGG